MRCSAQLERHEVLSQSLSEIRVSDRPSVVVVHPGARWAYNIALAAQEAGLLERFVTGAYYTPGHGAYRLLEHLPVGLRAKMSRHLLRRHQSGLAPEAVTSLAWLELPKLALLRGPAFVARTIGEARIVSGYTKLFEWYVSRSVPRAGHDILVAFQGCGLQLLRRARKEGVVSVLDQAAAPTQQRIMQEEYDRLGLGALAAYHMGEAHAVKELRLADWVMAPSEYVVDSLLEVGVSREKIAVIPFGVDLERFEPAEPKRPVSRPFTALFVGQISMRKGLHYLLRAWEELALADARLVLIGSPVDRFGWDLLGRFKHICTWLRDVPYEVLPRYYRQSDIFVLPTLADGSSLVSYEALASGLPVITTPNAGSVARDGVEGMIVPLRDTLALKRAILTLYEDKDLRSRMSTAARARAECFTWERYRERVGAMFQEVWRRSQTGL